MDLKGQHWRTSLLLYPCAVDPGDGWTRRLVEGEENRSSRTQRLDWQLQDVVDQQSCYFADLFSAAAWFE